MSSVKRFEGMFIVQTQYLLMFQFHTEHSVYPGVGLGGILNLHVKMVLKSTSDLRAIRSEVRSWAGICWVT